ncbi:MAG: hypothetical protein HFG41_05445 [Coprococcus sp.]|nr:hypothetical protein [Coprococcus sp.]
MSQEKVDCYKKEKANRKQTMRKEKTMRTVRGIVVGVVFVALVGWLGYSAVGLYTQSQPRKVAEVDYTAVDNYLQSLNEESGE